MQTKTPLRIGLTGGIASGKSTVADMFADLGATTIDTDIIAVVNFCQHTAFHRFRCHVYRRGNFTGSAGHSAIGDNGNFITGILQ